jgi:DNA repair protein RadA/Sms
MATKAKSVFICQSCGSRFPKWVGRCTGCGEWESVVEEVESSDAGKGRSSLSAGAPPTPVTEVAWEDQERRRSRFTEFDHILGGGIVPGSLTLIGGDPGIGKSTLMLQVSHSLSEKGHTVLYASGEESAAQIKLRAKRLRAESDNLLLYPENDLSLILAQMEKLRPDLTVIDSIQTVYRPDLPSAPGSVGQVRECAAEIMKRAKSLGTPVFLVGHVTKEGAIAGPRVLEHIVDTVLYFEGDRNNLHRILRVIKNRFGASNEIAVFEMRGSGLSEVSNPSEIFLSDRGEKRVGSVVACAMEGTRPLLLEIQALSSRMIFNYPQRVVSGMDVKRLSLICAVLERIAEYPLSQHDIFLSVAGGLTADEPAMDLPAAAAVISSFINRPVPAKTCVLGEIGLSGEIRSVGFMETRLREAQKLGFNRLIIPAGNAAHLAANPSLEVHGAADVVSAMRILFAGG